VTRTDVAQSEARLSLRAAALILPGPADRSEQNYRRVIGTGPAQLQPPPPLAAASGHADEAVQIALVQQSRPDRHHPPGRGGRL
jgi:hypothetical protein